MSAIRQQRDRRLERCRSGRPPRRRRGRRPVDVRDRALHPDEHACDGDFPRGSSRPSTDAASRRRLVDVDLRRGRVRCAEHGRVAPGPRPEAQLASGRLGMPVPACGEELRPVPTRESKPLIPTSVYAVNKRDHEELCLSSARRMAIPTVALRFFNVYGPGRRSRTRTRVSRRSSRRDCSTGSRRSSSRMVSSPVTSSTSTTSSKESSCALDADRAFGSCDQPEHRPPVVRQRRCRCARRGSRRRVEPELHRPLPGRRHPALLRRRDRAEELLGFGRRRARGRNGQLVQWLASSRQIDHVDAATRELEARGLAR